MIELLFIICTIMISMQKNLLTSNITTIANIPAYRPWVLVYFAVFLSYFAYQTLRIIKRYYHNRFMKVVLLINYLLLMTALFMPYQEEKKHDWFSTYHVSGGFWGFLIYGCIMSALIFQISMQDHVLYKKCQPILSSGIALTCLVMFSCGNINSLCEIILAITAAVLEYTILHHQT